MRINISDYSQEELKSIVRWEQLSLLEEDENDNIFLELLNEKNRSKIEGVLQMQITATKTYERVEKIRRLNHYLKKYNCDTITYYSEDLQLIDLDLKISDEAKSNLDKTYWEVFDFLRENGLEQNVPLWTTTVRLHWAKPELIKQIAYNQFNGKWNITSSKLYINELSDINWEKLFKRYISFLEDWKIQFNDNNKAIELRKKLNEAFNDFREISDFVILP